MGVIIGYCRGCLREYREGEPRDTSYPEPVHWECRGLIHREDPRRNHQLDALISQMRIGCVHVPG